MAVSPTLLQSANSPTGSQWVNGASSDVITFGSPTTAGSLLVAFVKQVTATPVVLNSVTDSQGNTWVVLPATTNSTISNIQIAYSLLTVGGTAATVTFNWAGAVSVAVGSIGEVSSIQNVRSVGLISGIESQTGSNTAPLCQFQQGVINDFFITVADGGVSNTHTQYTAPTVPSMTGVNVQGFVDADSFAWSWSVVNSQGFATPTWAITNTSPWACMCVSFAPPNPGTVAVPTASSAFPGGNQNPLAGNWSTWGSANAVKQVSNAIQASVNNAWCGAYWNLNAFGDNQFSEIVIGAADVVGALRGCGVRMSANGQATSGYMGIASGTGVYDLQRMVAGTPTIIGTAVGSAVSTGDVVRVTAFQNLITLSKNGVVLVCVYDPTILVGGQPGLVFNENSNPITSTITSWKGGFGGDSRYYQGTVIGRDATNQNTQSGPFTVPNLAGSLLVCCVGWPDASEPGTAISDTQNNTWVKLTCPNLSPFGQTIFYCLNAKGGANTVTVTRTANGHLPCTLGEWVGNGWTLNTSTSNSGSSQNVTASVTTTTANSVVIAYLGAVTNQSQGPIPGACFRNALGSEIKLYDFTATNAGLNTFTATLTAGTGNGLPTTGQQEIFMAAFSPPSSPLATAWSPIDSRQAVPGFGPGPNASRVVQNATIYDVQTSSNPAVPGVDSRVSKPVDCRIAPNIPQNSRAPEV